MGVNAILDPLAIPGGDRVVIGGAFRPNGSSAIDNTLNIGTGKWTVARTSAGLYTITLAHQYAKLVFALAPSLVLTTKDDKFVQWASLERTNVDEAVIRCWDVSGADVDDVASDAGNWIHFGLILANTGAPRP